MRSGHIAVQSRRHARAQPGLVCTLHPHQLNIQPGERCNQAGKALCRQLKPGNVQQNRAPMKKTRHTLDPLRSSTSHSSTGTWTPCRPLSAAWNRVTRAPLRPRCGSALCLGCGSGFGFVGAGLCHGAFALPEQEPFHVDCDPGHADPGPGPVDADGADEEPHSCLHPGEGMF